MLHECLFVSFIYGGKLINARLSWAHMATLTMFGEYLDERALCSKVGAVWGDSEGFIGYCYTAHALGRAHD